MNRQAYIAELSHLLYYMTPWDRDAAIEKYDRILEESSDLDALMQEIGTPMKLAVTLSRGYEPSPEPKPGIPKPTSEPTPEEDSSPKEEAAGEEPANEDIPSTEAEVIDEVNSSNADDESVTENESSAEDPSPAEEEPAEETEVQGEDVEIQAIEISSIKEPVHAETQPTEADAIFSEILNAATQAQSPVSLNSAQSTRRPRPGILIPYIIACILIGIPAMAVLLIVDLLIFGCAVMILVFGIYLLSFLGSAEFTGAGNRLVIFGTFILCVTAAAAIAVLAVWFLQNAVIGLARFLIRFGQEHGYAKEEQA